MASPPEALSTVLEPLSVEELYSRWLDYIEERRTVHEACPEWIASRAAGRSDEQRSLSNLSRLPQGAPASLGAPTEDGLGWLEDARCPFCPPYSLPLNATIETIQQTLSYSGPSAILALGRNHNASWLGE